MRVIPGLGDHFYTLDKILDYSFIPSITGGHVCSDEEESYLTSNRGGLSIPLLRDLANEQHCDSKKACNQLVDSIMRQERTYTFNKAADRIVRKEIHQKELKHNESPEHTIIRSSLTEEEIRTNDIERLLKLAHYNTFGTRQLPAKQKGVSRCSRIEVSMEDEIPLNDL